MNKRNVLLWRDYRIEHPDQVDRATTVAYLAALFALTRSGEAGADEQNAVLSLASSLSMDDSLVAEAQERSSDGSVFDILAGTSLATLLIRDALRVAIADGVIDDDEYAFVEGMADRLRLSATHSAWILSWVRRERELQHEWSEIAELG